MYLHYPKGFQCLNSRILFVILLKVKMAFIWSLWILGESESEAGSGPQWINMWWIKLVHGNSDCKTMMTTPMIPRYFISSSNYVFYFHTAFNQLNLIKNCCWLFSDTGSTLPPCWDLGFSSRFYLSAIFILTMAQTTTCIVKSVASDGEPAES